MARSLNTIQTAIKAKFIAHPTLRKAYNLDENKTFDQQFSDIAIENILIYVFSAAVWLLESMWDSFREEIEQRIEDTKVMSIRWYYYISLNYQHGDELVFNESRYSWNYKTNDASKRIVKYCAVREEISNYTTLHIYVSKDGKTALNSTELEAFTAYIKQVGAAGNCYNITSSNPEDIAIEATIYYKPTLIDNTGIEISTGNKVVEQKVRDFIDNIEYGGYLIVADLVNEVSKLDGVISFAVTGVSLGLITQDVSTRIKSNSGAFSLKTFTPTYKKES